jgi:nucleotide-binding universal stress UspA family protein
MTIIAGFSASRHSTASLHLAAQLARTTGEKVIAAAVLEHSPVPVMAGDPHERHFQSLVRDRTAQSLERTVDALSTDADISLVVHQATSIPDGLSELACRHRARMVVVGSSSFGPTGRITLGSVTERLVHTAAVAVAIAPREYPWNPLPMQRLTVAYGGAADTVRLVRTVVELSGKWRTQMRVASFSVWPAAIFTDTVETSAERSVAEDWTRRSARSARQRLEHACMSAGVADTDLVVGSGTDWAEAINEIDWKPGDFLVLGSAAAGRGSQVFLGSAAFKILRQVPVPVMIVPRRQT